MSMQSYGNYELLLDLKEINKIAVFKELYNKIEELYTQTDATWQEIIFMVFDDEYDDIIYKKLQEVIKEYKEKAFLELEINIYLTYIDSEAEGTDKAGEIIWCIEPELKSKINQFSDTWISWSIFG